jgi:gamma-glutamyltranspeptidase/glutathione hydrolase
MPDSYSAEVAARVLREGGNAVDATVASAFVLAVTLPEAGNLAGGGFMLAYVGGKPAFLDYREVAPAAATRDMYLDAKGEVIEGGSLTGHRAAGVPGTVAGLWTAHQCYGRKPWRELLAPAIALAEQGFVVHLQLEQFVREELPRLAGKTNFEKYYGALRAGQVFRQPELAAVLRRIAAQGPEDFYRGETAALIVAEMRRGGGLVTAEDLAAYQPLWREPLHARWRNFTVLSAPPPSSGGIAIVQLLKMKDALAPAFEGVAHNSTQYVHLLAEMDKRVFADRAEYLGDPGFVEVPVERLLDERYIATRAAEVNRTAISPDAAVKPGLEPVHTTHFSIVDRDGNAVANTYTLNTSFGSGVVVEGGGFLLNNEMDDFSIKPGVPNVYGVVGSTANEVQPGKRMLSSMSPTILLDDAGVRLVLGSPGGSTIISSVFETIVNVVDFRMTPAQAVGATRVHHQLLPPTEITYSPGRPLPPATIAGLRAMGYDARPHDWEFGDVQLVQCDVDSCVGASDPRGRGVSLNP